MKEQFKDTKLATRIRISKKSDNTMTKRKNKQKKSDNTMTKRKKDKRTNYDQQNTYIKLKIE